MCYTFRSRPRAQLRGVTSYKLMADIRYEFLTESESGQSEFLRAETGAVSKSAYQLTASFLSR